MSFLKINLFLQEAADQAVAPVADQVAVPVVVPVVVPAVAPVAVTVIMDLTEREAQEEMQNNRININTSSSRKPRNRININTNISIGRNPGHRISPISLSHSQTMPEEWSNSLPITGSPK